jgi:hypothetical protein
MIDPVDQSALLVVTFIIGVINVIYLWQHWRKLKQIKRSAPELVIRINILASEKQNEQAKDETSANR